MAFPVVSAQAEGSESTATTTHTVNLPSGIASGDLILLTIYCDRSNTAVTVTWPAGYTEMYDEEEGAQDCQFSAAYRIADGTEGTTITVTSNLSERAVHETWRITSWHGTTPPENGAFSQGTSTSADPPSLTPSWGAEDTLWFAIGAKNPGTNVLFTAGPTSYTNANFLDDGDAAGSAASGTARRELNATSEDPGGFTIASSVVWMANTIAVRPAAAAPAILPTLVTAPYRAAA